MSAATADDRIRQAEQDAARAREIEEERTSRYERVGSRTLTSLADFVAPRVTARVIREYVRAVMIEPVIQRMYDIGMGIETFDVPTEAGNTVNVPAAAKVQVDALKGLLQVGVPTQLGLVDDDGQTLPGVIALGELDMRSVQQSEHGARLASAAQVFSAPEPEQPAMPAPSPLTASMQERVAAGEYEVVEIEEGVGNDKIAAPDIPPPPIDESTLTPEQRILAKRRAKRATNGR